jgi:signal transduction histidine kinase
MTGTMRSAMQASGEMPEGLGMGLAIGRAITEAHARRLWTTHTSPQVTIFQGTRFVESGRGV